MANPGCSSYRQYLCLHVCLLLCTALMAACGMLMAGCGGGGGGGGGPGPSTVKLLRIVFIGQDTADNNPDAGDHLSLHFDSDVSLAGGASLDDMDFVFSPSGSLGTQTVSPTLISAREIRLILGVGTSFSPETSTLRLLSKQDAVIDSSSRLVPQSDVLTIENAGPLPIINTITFNEIPAILDGRGAAGGLLQVPQNGFTIELVYVAGLSAIDSTSLRIESSLPVTNGSATIAAGNNILPALSGTPGATSANLSVPASTLFSEGDHTLSVTIAGIDAKPSPPVIFKFRGKAINNTLRPFESQQVWFIDISRDIESIGSILNTIDNFTLEFPASLNTATPNNRSDFKDALHILGLQSGSPIANVSGSKDSNEVVLDIIQAEILAQLAALYPSVSVTFTFNSPGTFPLGQSFVLFDQASFSVITLGGNSEVGALGVAQFDSNNAHQEDNTLHASSNPSFSPRLGVFPHVVTIDGINIVNSPLELAMRDFVDHRSTPIGEDAADNTRLLNILATTAGDARQSNMETAINKIARLLAIVLAHECGHSMGLVKDLPPPTGLFGASATFPGSTTGHLTLASTSIFPAGAQEIMAPSLSFSASNHPATGFNKLFLSYLQEKVLYGN